MIRSAVVSSGAEPTWLSAGQDVLGDGDSVLGAAGPVHHAPPALHGEADVRVARHRPLVDAQHCGRHCVQRFK